MAAVGFQRLLLRIPRRSSRQHDHPGQSGASRARGVLQNALLACALRLPPLSVIAATNKVQLSGGLPSANELVENHQPYVLVGCPL